MSDVNAIAATILEGFDRHYRLFREICAGARQRFENADWDGIAEANRDRILMYDQRVAEATGAVLERFPEAQTDERLWPKIKFAYLGQLYEHRRPELAETFYNSVACRVLHRAYYHNSYLFWRPATSTEFIEESEPTYRSYYPNDYGLRKALILAVNGFGFRNRFRDLRYDIRCLLATVEGYFPKPGERRPNYQIQMLASPFYRNKAAYLVGRVFNGSDCIPFSIPVLQTGEGKLFLDTILVAPPLLGTLFSFSRAYFMADMDVPSAYVDFLKTVLPDKPTFEIYNMIGLQKQGKTMFYRELHHHLRYSTDNFIIAPGIRGMVMLVFTLPSFPHVFKIIRDQFEPPKEGNKQMVKEKYTLVKHHDRVGRLADTLEYSQVSFPLARISKALLDAMQTLAASNIEIDGDQLIVKHVYIERRMIPLNEYLNNVDTEARNDAINQYGLAIRELIGANIFPGDMMLKNFGVTRQRRVVFYDYDEICYMTDCAFRRIPPPGSWEDEMMDQPHFSVAANDVFPEQFSRFFFHDAQQRKEFYQRHAELVDPAFWIAKREQLLSGKQDDVLPYPAHIRFAARYTDRDALFSAVRGK